MMPSPKEFDEFDALVYRSTPGAPTVKVTDDADKINGDDWLKKNKSRGRHAPPTTAMPSSYLARKGNNTKLPPKLVIKFFIHEEVSSIQEMKSNNIDHISCHGDDISSRRCRTDISGVFRPQHCIAVCPQPRRRMRPDCILI